MNGWKTFSAMILTLFVLALVPSTFAALSDSLDITWVKIDGDEVSLVPADGEFSHSDNLVMERGQEFDVKVKVHANTEIDNLEISAQISGDKYSNKRWDMTYDFEGGIDLKEGDSDTIELSLKIPEDMEKDDNDYYKLRVSVRDADSFSYENTYQIRIEGIDSESAIRIDDFSFSPQEVVAGRAFTGLVRVENLGDDTIDDLKVTVSVPALNIQDTQYLDSDDEIESDEFQTFEELLLRVPMDAKPGTYEVLVTVEFDKYYEATAKGTVKIVEEKTASAQEDKSIITVTPSQEIAAGTSAIFPILIENTGKSSKTYTVVVTGLADWATYKIEPSSVAVVNSESKETVLLTVTAKEDAPTGDKSFVISIDTPQGSFQKAVTATITEPANRRTDWGKVQDGLTIGLIILVIILIILGLIIGFSKLRGSSEKEEETQTYY